MSEYIVGVEAGGTKFFVVLGTKTGEIKHRVRIKTTIPEETIPQVVEVLQKFYKDPGFEALGVASFGPIDPNPRSPTYGNVLSTTKKGWSHYSILENIRKEFMVPIAFDTDVNAALLCEWYWGCAVGFRNVIYVTVGTGIGAGVICNAQLLHGVSHTEIGHKRIHQNYEKDSYPGYCIFHGNCLEGLACGPAIKDRWNVESALDLPPDHVAWDLQSDYLAEMVHNLVCCYSPQLIILGGGVMKQEHLFPMIHDKVVESLNGYIAHCTLENVKKMVVPASFGENTGAKGALAMALCAEH